MIRRASLTWPILLGVTLLVLVVALLVIWVVGLASQQQWGLLAVGSVCLALVLVGVVMYFIITIKQVSLSQQQANFIDAVTHELKSPVASIKLYLQTLDLREVSPERQREFHRFMLEDVQRLDSLIDHLLVAAQLGLGGPKEGFQEVALSPLLQAGADAVRRRYNLSAEQIQVEVPSCFVRGTERELEMVFSNLLDNAVKYGGKTPRVIVRIKEQSEGMLRTTISDNGRGIRFELRRRVFDRFFRGGSELERTTQGTGLGLYIVKSLLRKMKGKVHVHGRGPLDGATFEVDLPGRLESVAISDGAPASLSAPPASAVPAP